MLSCVHCFLLLCSGFSAAFGCKWLGLERVNAFKESFAQKLTKTLQEVTLGTALFRSYLKA